MKPGQFAVRLHRDAPSSVLATIEKFDHVVITPNRLQPIGAYSDANVLSSAIYTGVIDTKRDVTEFSGFGLGFWLGTDDGLGDVLDTAVSNVAGSLSTWITALRPGSLAAGTVNNTGTSTLTYSYQYMSRREAIDHMCRAVGAEWRINPNGTLDAATPANLFANYTTPKAVMTRKPEGTEGGLVGLEAVDVVRSTDVRGYTTKVIAVGKAGDGSQLPVGTATQSSPYKDLLNNAVVMERLIDAPNEPANNITLLASSVLAMYGSQRQSLKLSSNTHLASVRVRPGDRVWVYDQRAGLVNSANQLVWRGELITPVLLRCKAVTWPIGGRMGVYVRRSGATPVYTDISDWVEREDDPTEWQVGTSDADPDQSVDQLGGAYLGDNPAIVTRANTGARVTYTPTSTNITGPTIVGSYVMHGNNATVTVEVLAGTIAATGTFLLSLPTGFVAAEATAAVGNKMPGGVLGASIACGVANGSNTILVYGDTAAGNWTAGASARCLITVANMRLA